jgi:hypothetical protein
MSNETKPKTIGELLNELPEPYKSQAIENATQQNLPGSFLLLITPTCKSKQQALRQSFVWAKSNEGHEYWADFYKTLQE